MGRAFGEHARGARRRALLSVMPSLRETVRVAARASEFFVVPGAIVIAFFALRKKEEPPGVRDGLATERGPKS